MANITALSYTNRSIINAIYIDKPVNYLMGNSFLSDGISSGYAVRPRKSFVAEAKSNGDNINDNPSLEFPTVYGYIQ